MTVQLTLSSTFSIIRGRPDRQAILDDQFRNNVIRAGLEALYFTGAHVLLQPIFFGVGAIFMLTGSAHALPVMREFDAPFTVYFATRIRGGYGQAVVDRAGNGDR